MADQQNHDETDPKGESKFSDKRRIDPETGEVRGSAGGEKAEAEEASADSAGPAASPEDRPGTPDATDEELVELLAEAERDLVAEYRDRAARAEAELKNFRTRVERDRQANREAVIAEVIRSLLPVIDDLDRAEKHGDLTEGTPLALIAQKLRGGFDRHGMHRVGELGEVFDPKLHEAIVQIPSADVEVNTIADVIEPGYALGDRLIRAAKVAVHTPQQ
ncbi:nucleotide exchange factor GrpE [Homoserinibacter sp. YIM 151385]|uniref:nucleotide exchange factor GrpE n=1 Tax=Homoserinibacter sp. YIM 151385 TaxID=2985506 RepID=UPI0022F107EF|nr:nucleotide exchange factor GrpE [Homoserinibacter sp. YIM 151385]WBU37310.1 nucleotide exchange factor GrpE [Homoserinibacter sp. YIM 151385]